MTLRAILKADGELLPVPDGPHGAESWPQITALEAAWPRKPALALALKAPLLQKATRALQRAFALEAAPLATIPEVIGASFFTVAL